MKRLLVGRRESAGTNAAAPTSPPRSVVPSVAPSAASHVGQPSETSSEYIASAPTMQNAPCERLIAPVTRKTSVNPRATSAKTLPWSSPPMTIWAASPMPPGLLLRLASGLAQRHPDVLRRIPARDDDVGQVEAALRRGGEVVHAVDAGEALEAAEIVAQLHRGDVRPELAQRIDHDEPRVPGDARRQIGRLADRLVLRIELLVLLFHRGGQALHLPVARPHGGGEVELLRQEVGVVLHLRVGHVAVGSGSGDVESGLRDALEDGRDGRTRAP